MCSIIGVGERLHKVFGQVDLGTLDSGERSLPFGLLVIISESVKKWGKMVWSIHVWGPVKQKCVFGSLRPGKIQTSLLSYRD